MYEFINMGKISDNNRPDIAIIDKGRSKLLIDPFGQFDSRMVKKENENNSLKKDLKRLLKFEIHLIQNMKKINFFNYNDCCVGKSAKRCR